MESLIVDLEADSLPADWETYVDSLLYYAGIFLLERTYGRNSNFRFLIVPKILFDDFDITILQLFILEMKTRARSWKGWLISLF